MIQPAPIVQTDPQPLAEARQILLTVFGYQDFRGHQADIIDHVVRGGDALVLMPTGSGKSLCYQIPALVRKKTGIVISPLIALMQNQVDALAQQGVRAAFLNSSLERNEAWQIEQKLRRGEIDILYVAPERLATEPFLALLDRIPKSLFAIDEAHCISQWGHDFRPEYAKLSLLHERFPDVPRIALTATADSPTRKDIARQLALDGARHFVSSFDRANIRYRVADGAEGRAPLLAFLDEAGRRGQSGIVYCPTRRKVEETAAWLSGQGFPALPYHAGLDQETRSKNQQRFLREDGLVMTATVAFGMGIDKPDIRFVAHLGMPQSLESYYQETGRAGRDGAPAEVWMSYGLGDVVRMGQRIDQSEAPDQQKRIMRQKLNAMLGYCESAECRRTFLLGYFGEDSQPCGNCDTCLAPKETWDGTIAAQKILSAALRTNQRFGANYLIDILLGKATDRIVANGHDKLPTFGAGQDVPETAWRAIMRQIVAADLLRANAERHGALELTDKARPILRNETVLLLRKIEDKPRKSKRTSREKQQPDLRPVDEPLLAALRACRKRLAEAQNVPAYLIFHDSTLEELAQQKPETLEDLLRISGIGQRKAERYGAIVLDILNRHRADNGAR